MGLFLSLLVTVGVGNRDDGVAFRTHPAQLCNSHSGQSNPLILAAQFEAPKQDISGADGSNSYKRFLFLQPTP
jgi:hypothetical protein